MNLTFVELDVWQRGDKLSPNRWLTLVELLAFPASLVGITPKVQPVQYADTEHATMQSKGELALLPNCFS